MNNEQHLSLDRRCRLIHIMLTVSVVVLLIISLLIGNIKLSLWAIAHEHSWQMVSDLVIQIRLPRSLLAIIVGFSLGLSGAVLQAYLRNPLAEPSVLGTSAAAAMGAIISIYFGIASHWAFATPLFGIMGSLLGLMIIVFIAGREASVLILILAGVAVSTLAGAMTSLILNLAPSPYAALEIVFWLLGSFANRDLSHVLLVLPFMVVGCALLFACARSLNALSFGEEVAHTLGINLNRLKWLCIAGVSLCVGAGVGVSGAIGFVGLVVPHLVRPLVENEPRRLLLPSALMGALLLLCADILVRLIPSQAELKVGVITSLIGAPFFLYLLFKKRHELK